METERRHRRNGDRIEAALVLFLAVGMLVVASLLAPDPSGYGTHRKLLVVPCIFRTVTHLPCPFCGLTTAYSYMARLQVADAFAAHALGPLAYVLTWAAGLRAIYALALGVPVFPAWMSGRRATNVLLLVLLLGWIVNVVRVLTA